jgi:hypothetical protein
MEEGWFIFLSSRWAEAGSCIVKLLSIASVPEFLLYLQIGQL